MNRDSVAATACVILLRSVDGSYAPGGKYFGAPATRAGGWLGLAPKMLVLSANLGLAYIAHYNAPPLAGSLAPGREPAEAARDFSAVTVRSFAVLVALYAAVMVAGAATFDPSWWRGYLPARTRRRTRACLSTASQRATSSRSAVSSCFFFLAR